MFSRHSYLFIIIGLFSINACAPVSTRLPSIDIAGFEAEFNTFQSYYNFKIRDISIRLDSSMVYPELGLCSASQDWQPKITINANHWFISSAPMREQLVFHELGHCVLGLAHDDSRLSIMNTYDMPEAVYTINRTNLILSLFSR